MSYEPPGPIFSLDAPQDGGLTILLVEDGADSALSLGFLLHREGHAVQWAQDGPAALRRIQDGPPDVLLLDLGLPRMSGYEVACRVREMGLWKRPFVIAVTGFGREEHRRRSADAGVDLHLVKPVAPEDLLALLRRFRSVLRA